MLLSNYSTNDLISSGMKFDHLRTITSFFHLDFGFFFFSKYWKSYSSSFELNFMCEFEYVCVCARDVKTAWKSQYASVIWLPLNTCALSTFRCVSVLTSTHALYSNEGDSFVSPLRHSDVSFALCESFIYLFFYFVRASL